jgi:hypothetical protein
MKKEKLENIEEYLIYKRNEIVWSLVSQGYTPAQITRMFSNLGRSNTHKIVVNCPKNYKSPWVKVR